MNAESYYKNTYLKCKDKLYRFSYHFLKSEDEAKDATQDALIKIWDKKQIWHEIENPEAWAMQIVKNVCLEKIRKQKTVEKHADYLRAESLHSNDPGKISLWQNQWEIMQEVMEQLSEKQKAVFILREVEGYPYQEIAQVLEITEAQVKSDLHRSRKFLKQCMQKINDHGIKAIR